MSDTVIKRACEAAGGIAKLARAIGIKHTAIYSWDRIPADRIVDIERATGIPRQQLRPDLYEGMRPVTSADMDAARYEEALMSSAPVALP